GVYSGHPRHSAAARRRDVMLTRGGRNCTALSGSLALARMYAMVSPSARVGGAGPGDASRGKGMSARSSRCPRPQVDRDIATIRGRYAQYTTTSRMYGPPRTFEAIMFGPMRIT